ncbi:hypothetical protein HK097_002823 [Rhizophlyctis rosea]|uniref:Uncharacterized protein n=1 Tax=Rhizophlyctis rosea TaxID=64517 RepID=A0AAD5WY79_9FUNG|nr:hypothetical protein HK097_002823 [Rhizophlyctis rosea]
MRLTIITLLLVATLSLGANAAPILGGVLAPIISLLTGIIGGLNPGSPSSGNCEATKALGKADISILVNLYSLTPEQCAFIVYGASNLLEPQITRVESGESKCIPVGPPDVPVTGQLIHPGTSVTIGNATTQVFDNEKCKEPALNGGTEVKGALVRVSNCQGIKALKLTCKK